MHAFFVLAVILLLLYSRPFRGFVVASIGLLILIALAVLAVQHKSTPVSATNTGIAAPEAASIAAPATSTASPSAAQAPANLPAPAPAMAVEAAPIAEEEVQLAGLALHPGAWKDALQLAGRIRNVSQISPLRRVVLRIRLQDRPAPSTGEALPWTIPMREGVSMTCDTVLDQEQTILVKVPPGEARDFTSNFHATDPIRQQGAVVWHYDLVSVS
jgi:hypothetical protein